MAEDIKQAAVAPIAPEAAKPAAVETTKPDQTQERLQLLSRKEKAIRMQQINLQRDRAAFEAQRNAKPAEPPPPPTNWDAKLAEDPMGVIRTAASTIETLQAEIAALKSGQTKALDEVKASQKSAYNQAVKQVARDVKLLTDGNDSYEAINAQSAHSAVVEFITMTYKEDGILLSAQEAADQIEEYLTEEAMRLSSLKKIKAKLAPPEQKTQAPKTPEQWKTSTPTVTTRTLTHSAATTPTKRSSEHERKQRAILAMQGQLK